MKEYLNVGDKALTLIMSALAGGDCIDDVDALRAGATAALLGQRVAAPSTCGTSPALRLGSLRVSSTASAASRWAEPGRPVPVRARRR